MSHILFIINPAGHGGLGMKVWNEFKSLWPDPIDSANVIVTERPGHAREIAAAQSDHTRGLRARQRGFEFGSVDHECDLLVRELDGGGKLNRLSRSHINPATHRIDGFLERTLDERGPSVSDPHSTFDQSTVLRTISKCQESIL